MGIALILAIIALAAIPKYGRKGILGYACGGIVTNLLIIVGCISLFFATKRVAEVFNGSYSKDEMIEMPRVISDSQVVINEEIGFRIEIPSGFVENPLPQQPRVLYSFVRVYEDNCNIAINIERLGGRIGKETPSPEELKAIREHLPPDSAVGQALLSWDKYEVVALVSQFTMNGLKLCSRSVQIPLSREAIQINVAGFEELSSECQSVMDQVLESLKGKSNWVYLD